MVNLPGGPIHLPSADTIPPNEIKIAETYFNPFTMHKLMLARYWINDKLLIGGNVFSKEDWKHLQDDFGIGAVINVDGISDKDYGIENLLEVPVPDDGTHFSKENVLKIIDFYKQHSEKPVYLHCHLGMSRSPHFAYAILREAFNMNQEEAYLFLKCAIPFENRWGFSQHSQSYVASIEEALK